MSQSEKDYERGHRAAWISVLRTAMAELGISSGLEALTLERAATVAALREACEEFGDDNDWPDNLSLVDVIEKHLLRHVREAVESGNESE